PAQGDLRALARFLVQHVDVGQVDDLFGGGVLGRRPCGRRRLVEDEVGVGVERVVIDQQRLLGLGLGGGRAVRARGQVVGILAVAVFAVLGHACSTPNV